MFQYLNAVGAYNHHLKTFGIFVPKQNGPCILLSFMLVAQEGSESLSTLTSISLGYL